MRAKRSRGGGEPGPFTVRDAAAAKALEAMYMGTGDSSERHRTRHFEAVALLQSLQKTPYQPRSAQYRRDASATASQIAHHQSRCRVEVAFAIWGLDHHVQEVGPRRRWPTAARLTEFGGLWPLLSDLGTGWKMCGGHNVGVRRAAKENGDRAAPITAICNACFVMGGLSRRQGLRQWPDSRGAVV